ncbi:DUF2867 domain-containing protein [Pseudophaeobacter flagellatus]|uniref:DUF2867 domain-containing protein n=1 Tax=Pseudophaeobacter flagellatus TaxID=2899119 RepID=UPI001E2CD160|nr:DUF2867 domain-containing protein [Pseudophaeobacter flagellatus]MCD9146331.1 DUF2867 domain-containing protein [Pseudophaeobacter flagellatus]
MGHVTAMALPASSLLFQQPAGIQPGDFIDCYASSTDRPLEEAAERAFKFPVWVSALMRLRNLLVTPFGLNTKVTSPQKVGFFPLVCRSDDELILGLDDSHLDFRISVLKQDGLIYFATWVRTKNRFGRLYLRLIMPFHVLIVRNAVKRV